MSDVTRRIADGSSRQVVVLLGSQDGAAAKRAQSAFAAAMAKDADHALLVPSGSIEGWFDEARAFYAPYRDRLLTPAQREQLKGSEPGALAEQALAALYGPMAPTPDRLAPGPAVAVAAMVAAAGAGLGVAAGR